VPHHSVSVAQRVRRDPGRPNTGAVGCSGEQPKEHRIGQRLVPARPVTADQKQYRRDRVVPTLVHHIGADCFERPRLVQIDDAFGPRLAAHAAQVGPARTRKCARMKLSPPAEGIGNREHDELGDRDALH
jgi:hypothetical protein